MKFFFTALRKALFKRPRMSVEEVILIHDAAFVQAIYRYFFGRIADEDGLRLHIGALRNGLSRANLVEAISRSAEASARGGRPFSRGGIHSVETFILRSDHDFIWALYEFVLHRAPDLPGVEYHIGQLHAGRSRWELLRSFFRSNEIERVNQTLSSKPARASAEEILLVRNTAFVQAAYRYLLGRTADEDGLRLYCDALDNGLSRPSLLRTISHSGEASARGIKPLNEVEIIAAETLLLRDDKDFLWAFYNFVINSATHPVGLEDYLAKLKVGVSRWEILRNFFRSNEGSSLTNAVSPLSSASSIATFKGVAANPKIFLLFASWESIEPTVSDFVRRFIYSWAMLGVHTHVVFWDASAKEFLLANWEQLTRLKLASVAEQNCYNHSRWAESTTILDHSSCGPGDWLLVLEPFRTHASDSRLIEMDGLLKARMLKLHSAFIFHGSQPLRSKKSAGVESAAHEQYMQAMLLADLVIPVSTLAVDDINNFFVQHQKADFGPAIKKVALPAEVAGGDGMAPWLRYVHCIRGLLTDAVDPSHHVQSLYYLHPPENQYSSAQAAFSQRLAHAFCERGIALIPARWEKNALICSKERGSSEAAINSESFWSDWTRPGDVGAPRWIFISHDIGGKALDAIKAFAVEHGLRVAAVLHRVPGSASTIESADSSLANLVDLESYSGVEKIFAVSDLCLAELNKFLLGQRSKVHSAEHRFKVLEVPNEVPGRPKRIGPKISTSEHVNVLMWLSQDFDGAVLSAVENSISLLNDRLICTVATSSSWAIAHAEMSKIGPLSKLRWIINPGDKEMNIALEEADFVIVASTGRDVPRILNDALWYGLPCLIHGASDDSAALLRCGLMSVDMHDCRALAASIVELVDAEWRRNWANKVIEIPPRYWDNYVRGVLNELANDRATDTLHYLKCKDRSDVYGSLVNLRPRPKLSLCISTYKRAGWLSLNLRNIFSQINVPRQDLEILVVDNASPDTTPEIVEPYLQRPDFRYHRNLVNVGMLGNLAVTAQKARGEYVWILGDDDFTRPGIIERVLHLLNEQPDLRLIYMNYGYTNEQDPTRVTNLALFLEEYNVLEPKCSDERSTVKEIATKTENFYTAIYSHIYRRDDALRSYCQDTSGRVFSTITSCIPTTVYVLSYLADAPAYWLGEPSLVVNSNVSWVEYAPLFELEQFPRGLDLAERMGSSPAEVDCRRNNRLWIIAAMWKNLFENDHVGNSAFVSAPRVWMRLKHLEKIDQFIDTFIGCYKKAYNRNHPAATMPPEELFAAFSEALKRHSQ